MTRYMNRDKQVIRELYVSYEALSAELDELMYATAKLEALIRDYNLDPDNPPKWCEE